MSGSTAKKLRKLARGQTRRVYQAFKRNYTESSWVDKTKYLAEIMGYEPIKNK